MISSWREEALPFYVCYLLSTVPGIPEARGDTWREWEGGGVGIVEGLGPWSENTWLSWRLKFPCFTSEDRI